MKLQEGSLLPTEIGIVYDPNVTLQQLCQLWVDRSVDFHKGNLAAAAQALGVGRATIYRTYKKRSGRG